jgi:hypothetical protein
MHVPDIDPVLAEFVRVLRVLRPSGHLVVSDSRGLIPGIGLPVVKEPPGGSPGYMPIRSRLTGDYLAVAHDRDFEIYLVSADGSGRRNLTRSHGDDAFPVWSAGATN